MRWRNAMERWCVAIEQRFAKRRHTIAIAHHSLYAKAEQTFSKWTDLTPCLQEATSSPRRGNCYVIRKRHGHLISSVTSHKNKIGSISCDVAAMLRGDVQITLDDHAAIWSHATTSYIAKRLTLYTIWHYSPPTSLILSYFELWDTYDTLEGQTLIVRKLRFGACILISHFT